MMSIKKPKKIKIKMTKVILTKMNQVMVADNEYAMTEIEMIMTTMNTRWQSNID